MIKMILLPKIFTYSTVLKQTNPDPNNPDEILLILLAILERLHILLTFFLLGNYRMPLILKTPAFHICVVYM